MTHLIPSAPCMEERGLDNHGLSDIELEKMIKNERQMRQASMKRRSTQPTWV